MAYLNEAGRALVSDAVTAAELQSAGEIVTIITDRSDGYTDVALAWAVLAAFTALIVMAFFPAPFLALYDALLGGWNSDHTPTVLFAIAVTVGIAKFLGVMAFMLIDAVRFVLIPGPIKTARAHGRAVDLFKASAERRTHGRTGILIYLSMKEHRAEIIADEAIAGKVEPEIWGDAMAAMLADLKQGRVAEGMAAAVGQVGAILAQHFPRDEHDTNELPDRLIEL